MKDLSRALGFALTLGHLTFGPLLPLHLSGKARWPKLDARPASNLVLRWQSLTPPGRSSSTCPSLCCHRRKQIVCPLLIEMHFSSDPFLKILCLYLRFRHVLEFTTQMLLQLPLLFVLKLPLLSDLPHGKSSWRPSRSRS